jgi:hypothetical protein
VIVCLLMSGLYLNLSERNDNVERAAEASVTESEYTRVMRRALLTRTFLTRSRLTRGLAALAVLGATIACDDAGPTTPTDTTPVATPFTETFSGTLPKNGALTFPFNAEAAGTATATLAAVGPDNTVPLGFAMGTWNGVTCHTVLANDNALEFAQVVGSVGSSGSLCLRIYDIGRVATSATFTLTVVHP